jgi:hypothetical protein
MRAVRKLHLLYLSGEQRKRKGDVVSRRIVCLCCVMLFAVLSAMAGQWDKITTVTFRQPIELPGFTLQPGTYVFVLADTPSSRHVIQVFILRPTCRPLWGAPRQTSRRCRPAHCRVPSVARPIELVDQAENQPSGNSLSYPFNDWARTAYRDSAVRAQRPGR